MGHISPPTEAVPVIIFRHPRERSIRRDWPSMRYLRGCMYFNMRLRLWVRVRPVCPGMTSWWPMYVMCLEEWPRSNWSSIFIREGENNMLMNIVMYVRRYVGFSRSRGSPIKRAYSGLSSVSLWNIIDAPESHYKERKRGNDSHWINGSTVPNKGSSQHGRSELGTSLLSFSCQLSTQFVSWLWSRNSNRKQRIIYLKYPFIKSHSRSGGQREKMWSANLLQLKGQEKKSGNRVRLANLVSFVARVGTGEHWEWRDNRVDYHANGVFIITDMNSSLNSTWFHISQAQPLRLPWLRWNLRA